MRSPKVPRQKPPFGAALALARIFHSGIDRLAVILDRNVVKPWKRNPNLREDANTYDVGLKRTKREAKKIFDDDALQKPIDVVSSRIDKKNGVEMKSLIPVSIYKEVGGKKIIAGFRSDCVDRIQSIVGDDLDTLSDLLDEAGRKGFRVEDIAKTIKERLDVTESKATLLARDQTLKFNAKLTQARQVGSGIERYTWSTSGDERVRPMHDDLDGTIQSWDDPPETNEDGDTNAPGEDYQCRCVAIPVLPDSDDTDDEADE